MSRRPPQDAQPDPRRRFARLALAGMLVLPAAPGAQEAMVNGQNYVGAIAAPGEIDTYTFTAAAGDVIVLAVGEIGPDSDLSPWIRLFDPSFVPLSSVSGSLAAQTPLIVAAATGTFTVQVASNDAGFDGTGDYTLTLARAPGAFAVSPGDEGGPMTNGANHTGIIHIGDLDMWSFTANAGDALSVHIGETGGNTAFAPWIRLIGPNGHDFGGVQGPVEAAINVPLNASLTGTYTVIVASADIGFDASGTYTLTIANTGTFVVPPGDQGGAIVVGDPTNGSLHIGDADMWTFSAHANDPLTVTVTDLNTPGTVLSPLLRLRTPTDISGINVGATTATIT